MWKQKHLIEGSLDERCFDALRFSANDHLFAGVDRRNHLLEVWDVEHGELHYRLQRKHLVDVAFCQKGEWLAVAIFHYGVERRLDFEFYETSAWTLAESLSLPVPREINHVHVSNIAVSSDGFSLTYGIGHTLYPIHLTHGQPLSGIHRLHKYQNPYGPIRRLVRTRRDDRIFDIYLLVQAGRGGSDSTTWLTWWNPRAGATIKTIELPGKASELCCFTNTNTRVILTEGDGSTYLFDLETEEIVRAFHNGGNADLHPDGVMLASGSLNRLTLYNLQTGAVIFDDLLGGYIDAIAFSPSGRLLGACRGCALYLWEYDRQVPVYAAADWFRAAAFYFRRLGFFADAADVPDGEFVQQLRVRYEEEHYGILPERASKHETMKVLALDQTRVWWRDTECVHSAETYRRILQEWSAISGGAFQPEGIQVSRGKKYEDPVQIAFEQREQPVALTVPWQGDWLYVGLLKDLNRVIADTPIRFESYYPFDQTAVIIALTAEQKSRLMADLDWHFASYGGF